MQHTFNYFILTLLLSSFQKFNKSVVGGFKTSKIIHFINEINLHTRAFSYTNTGSVYGTLVGAANCKSKMVIVQTIFDEFP
jgi:hypothetical protein